MTAPVGIDDLVQGAARYLKAESTVLAVVGRTEMGTPMVFQYAPIGPIEGTSMTAAVLGYGGGWAGGNDHNTLRFPRLSLELWVDPYRRDGHMHLPEERYRRLDVVFQAFDRLLHRVGGGEQWWGTVRTISSLRAAEPVIFTVPDGDGLLRAQVFYNIEMG